MTQTKPNYQHDCARCTYLGPYSGPGGHLDLWWCPNSWHPALASVILRYGSEGPEYSCTHPPEAFAAPEQYIDEASQPYLVAMALATRAGLYRGQYAATFLVSTHT